MRSRFLSIVLSCISLPSATLAQDGLVSAARDRVGVTVTYDPSYVSLTYPGGDIKNDRGVCTDVLIRALRSAYGFDLQQEVHDDMRAAFDRYPARWGLKKPDRNIDHRRVPNLETYLRRQNAEIPTGKTAEDFSPGDIVTWRVAGRMPHIGIVSDDVTPTGDPLIIHNMGGGTLEEDVLFRFPITAQFRFHPDPSSGDSES